MTSLKSATAMSSHSLNGDGSGRIAMRLTMTSLLALLAACGEQSGSANLPSTTSVPSTAVIDTNTASVLRLTATVESEPYLGQPACMVSFVIENRHDKTLAIFGAPFRSEQVSTGKALTTVTKVAGNRVGVANLPLAPGATGNPWKQNVLGASCEDIALRFEDKFVCEFDGQPCSPGDVEVQQQGLASVTGLRS
jgi:hypothetical protein